MQKKLINNSRQPIAVLSGRFYYRGSSLWGGGRRGERELRWTHEKLSALSWSKMRACVWVFVSRAHVRCVYGSTPSTFPHLSSWKVEFLQVIPLCEHSWPFHFTSIYVTDHARRFPNQGDSRPQRAWRCTVLHFTTGHFRAIQCTTVHDTTGQCSTVQQRTL